MATEKAKTQNIKTYKYDLTLHHNDDMTMLVAVCNDLDIVSGGNSVAEALDDLIMQVKFYMGVSLAQEHNIPPSQTEYRESAFATIEIILGDNHNDSTYTIELLKNIVRYKKEEQEHATISSLPDELYEEIKTYVAAQKKADKTAELLLNSTTQNNDTDTKKTAVQKFTKRVLKASGSEDLIDPIIEDIVKLIAEQETASTSFIQRRFTIGYARAARILDWLEEKGFVGEVNGSKPREVYITKEILNKYGFDGIMRKLSKRKIKSEKPDEVITTKTSDTVVAPNNKTRITVLGVGGGGIKILESMPRDIRGVELSVVDTDSDALESSSIKKKHFFGESYLAGKGNKGDPQAGEKIANECLGGMYALFKDTDMAIIVAGLGGGFGSGAAPVIARKAKELGIFTVVIATHSLSFEGGNRAKISNDAVQKLKESADATMIIPSEFIAKKLQNTAISGKFKEIHKIIGQTIFSMTSLLTNTAMINLDFVDLKTVLKGSIMIGAGKGKGSNRALDAAKAAVNSPLVGKAIKQSKKLMLNITGSHDMTLDEVMNATNAIKEIVDPSAMIIFGCDMIEDAEDEIVVTIFASKEADNENG